MALNFYTNFQGCPKVVIVTSSNLSRDKAKAANFRSVTTYITKPVTEEVLLELYKTNFN